MSTIERISERLLELGEQVEEVKKLSNEVKRLKRFRGLYIGLMEELFDRYGLNLTAVVESDNILAFMDNVKESESHYYDKIKSVLK